MGWTYRKSMKVGPFRINASGSGLGMSVGSRGFRVGVDARGRRYTSFSVPGVPGLQYRSSRRTSGPGCATVIVAPILWLLGRI